MYVDKILCANCLKTNECSCGTTKHHLKFEGGWGVPGVNARKNIWREFLKRTKNIFRRKYVLSKDKEVREAIEKIYTMYNLSDIFENARVLRTRSELNTSDKFDIVPDTRNTLFEVAIDEEAVGKYGGGLYMKLRLELAKNNEDYESMHVRIQNKEDTPTIKIYNQLRRKIKKITGCQFELKPVKEKQLKNHGYSSPQSKPSMVWVGVLKLPPVMQKIPGSKKIVMSIDGFRQSLGDL